MVSHRREIQDKSSVLIIGSGITGLCLGALLSKTGYQVDVLEKHPESFGGHARSLKRGGYWFCCGPQYLWNFRNNKIGPRVLAYLGLTETVPIESMHSDGFERCFLGDGDFIDIPMGLSRFRDLMMTKFPEEERRLDRLFVYIKAFHETCDYLNDVALFREGATKILPFILSHKKISWKSKARSLLFSLFSVKTLFDFCGISQEARRVLYAHGGIFLENESEVSCLAYGATTGFYHSGADFPQLGFRNMIGSLVQCIEDHGGNVELGKEVSSLEVTKRRITKVVCKDGSVFHPDHVISNVAPSLMKKMLREPALLKYNYQPSHPCVGLFIGVDSYPGILDLMARRNLWWQDGKAEVEYSEADMTNPRMLYVCSPSSNSLENRNDHPDHHSIMVFSAGCFRQDREMKTRGQREYDEFRNEIQCSHMRLLEKHIFPDLHKYTRYTALFTPVDFHEEINLEMGGVYGRRAIARNLMIKPIRVNKIANLDFACAATGAAGIASGFQTAAVLFSELTGKSI